MQASPSYRYRILIISTEPIKQVWRFCTRPAPVLCKHRGKDVYFNTPVKGQRLKIAWFLIFADYSLCLNNDDIQSILYTVVLWIFILKGNWFIYSSINGGYFISLRQLTYSVNYSFIFSKNQFILLFLVNTKWFDIYSCVHAFAFLKNQFKLLGISKLEIIKEFNQFSQLLQISSSFFYSRSITVKRRMTIPVLVNS